MKTLLEVLRKTEGWFRDRGIPSPRHDAELLLAHVLGVGRLDLYLQYDRPLEETELAALRPLVKRRGQREPIHYLLGARGFHNIDLKITSNVLVPRPDTEILVEAALEWFGEVTEPLYVADIGSGSGAVGLALAAAVPELRLYATDVSPDALALTKENATALGLSDRVAVLRGSLLTPIPQARPIDWVVSNPPYIPSATIDTLEPEVRVHEPRLALDGGRDGLDVYHQLIPSARQRARKGLLVEIGYDQAKSVSALFESHGFEEVRVWKDFGGNDRVVAGKIPTA